jgi:hypothetical protein
MATAYAILQGLRVILAVHFVLPREDTVEIVKIVLEQVKKHQIRVNRLILDKGLGIIAMMDYLTRQGPPVLIACTIRGKTGGRRALCQGHKRYRTTYTFKGKDGFTSTANLVVCRIHTTAKRTKRLKPRPVWFDLNQP